jgi:uncharacterized membrane protein
MPGKPGIFFTMFAAADKNGIASFRQQAYNHENFGYHRKTNMEISQVMNPYLQSFFLSLLPISELRGGIPLAYANDIPIATAYVLCVLSNILVIPLLYIFLNTLHRFFYRLKPYRLIFDKYVRRTQARAEEKVRKYGYWGVMLFVAIPLPITGAYTGTLAAWLLKLKFRKAFWYLALGVVIAGVVVTIATLTGAGILKIFIKQNPS